MDLLTNNCKPNTNSQKTEKTRILHVYIYNYLWRRNKIANISPQMILNNENEGANVFVVSKT